MSPASRVRHPWLAREGWPHIAVVLVLACVATRWAGPVLAGLAWLVAVLVIQFFRDPPRAVPVGEELVLCPADGRVIALGQVHDPYMDRAALRISIFMNVFNVHSNRAPVGGQILKRWYQPGSFVNAALDKASESNERNALWIRTQQGADVVVVQIAGLVARRILCYVDVTGSLAAGERYGFIRFGSRVDVYLPVDALPRVALGDKVHGGSDIAAVLSGARMKDGR